MEEEKTPSMLKALRICALALGILAIILVLVCILVTKNLNNVETTSQMSSEKPYALTAPQVDSNAGEYDQHADDELYENDEPDISIPGWAEIKILADKTDINSVDFYNPEENTNYYLTFEIRLPDSSAQGYEVLFTSGSIEPGKHLQHISLNRPVAAGEYNATVFVQPYRISDGTPTNSAEFATKLIAIKN